MSVLVGKAAPEFTLNAVYGDNQIKPLSLTEHRGRYVLLFFYPLDFTFVCPSELIALDHRLAEFAKRNTDVVAVSIDSEFTHLAWKNTPVNQGGIGQVGYPLVADIKHTLCQAYGVEDSDGTALRGSFLIDRAGVVQHQSVNNASLGRNIDDLLRLIDALQFNEEHGDACPAGWQKGDAGIAQSPAGVAAYLAENAAGL
ncbi:MAG: peroxiredoxin [Rhodocyclaceae bacterium]|nr:peroxiredoxin [Rhodocyclaceae bacterium]MBK9625909.1 peroxiredoxin [Rhodocyclaceae bacterium]MBP6109465.1 peroxiredoxin [Rhodocyclaceae bacterium]MBP6278601.1 peroxiredoxin [Rhodocyclaceae bacterium]